MRGNSVNARVLTQAASFMGFPTLEESPIIQQKLALPSELNDQDIEKLFSRREGGAEFRKEHNIDPNATVICLLPGSRKQEIIQLLPIYKDAIKLIHEKIENLHIIIPVVNDTRDDVEDELIYWNDVKVPRTIVFHGYLNEDTIYQAYSASDIAIACSGSVTVELALGGLPTIVTYSASKLTEYVFRIFSWVKSVSIPNLLLQSEVIPELLFGKLNAKDLAEKALQLISDKEAQKQQITNVRSVLPTLLPYNPITKKAIRPSSIAGDLHSHLANIEADVILEEFVRNVHERSQLKRSWFSRLFTRKPKVNTQAKDDSQKWFIEGLDVNLLENKTIDRVLGCIYGNALGDAFGLSTEFQSKSEIEKLYGDNPIPFPNFQRNRHNKKWDVGDWTDDTETLLETQRADERTFAYKLDHWANNGFPELGDIAGAGLGATVHKAIQNERFIEEPHAAAHQAWIKMNKNAAANGAIMRTSILGVWEHQDLKKVEENTVNICKVTHYDSRCIASCAMATNIIASMLNGAATSSAEDKDALVQSALNVALPYLEQQYENEIKKYIVKDGSLESLKSLQLDDSTAIGYTFKCLGSGIWGLYSDREFKETLNLLAKEGGDADTNGAVCGALVGAKLGYSQLPKDWLVSMRNKDWYEVKNAKMLIGRLDKKAVKLLKAMKLI